jgi:sulfur carrier protein
MIKIVVNGKAREIEPPESISEMLADLGVNAKQVAVAVNGEVVRRVEWNAVTVSDGDAVEIVRAVGGGCGASARDRGARCFASRSGRRGALAPPCRDGGWAANWGSG